MIAQVAPSERPWHAVTCEGWKKLEPGNRQKLAENVVPGIDSTQQSPPCGQQTDPHAWVWVGEVGQLVAQLQVSGLNNVPDVQPWNAWVGLAQQI